jgi:hypothetical protein
MAWNAPLSQGPGALGAGVLPRLGKLVELGFLLGSLEPGRSELAAADHLPDRP